jgi:hypothetical protein
MRSTCWPFDGTLSDPLRYLVHAELTAVVPAQAGTHTP